MADLCTWRLEIHGVFPKDAAAEAKLLFQQLALVVRRLPDPFAVVFDINVNGVWRRRGYPWGDGPRATPYRWATFPVSRIATVRRARENSPDLIGAGDHFLSIRRALDHYEESVRSLQGANYDMALVLAALSHEALLGDDLQMDLSYRLRLRGAGLTSPPGPARESVFAKLNRLYSARSKVVHGGKHASRQDVTHYQQFLMRAIPSFIELTKRLGSTKEAVRALDAVSLGSALSPTDVNEVASGGNELWWSYVDLASCFARSLPALAEVEPYSWYEY